LDATLQPTFRNHFSQTVHTATSGNGKVRPFHHDNIILFTRSCFENPGAEEKLAGIGFVLDTKLAANDVRFHNVYSALKRYKEIYGDMVLVPQPFEVPDKSPDWPDDTWGLHWFRMDAVITLSC
jgi:hypothetical protein